MKKYIFILLVIFAIVFVQSCDTLFGSEDDDDPAVVVPPGDDPDDPDDPSDNDDPVDDGLTTVSGTFSSTTAPTNILANGVSAQAISDWSQYELWVCSWTDYGDYIDQSFDNGTIIYDAYPISADGSFAVEIDEGKKFAAFLADPDADLRKVIGVIGVGVGGGSDAVWDAVDTAVTGDSIDFGLLTANAGTINYLSEYTVSDLVSDSGDREAVALAARLDDMLKMLENQLNYPLMETNSWWEGTPIDMNAVTDPSLLSDAVIEGVSITVDNDALPENENYDDPGQTIYLIPPSDVEVFAPFPEPPTTTTYSPSSPLSVDSYTDDVEFPGMGGDFSSLPDGYYQIAVDTIDNVVCEFHGGTASSILSDGRLGRIHPVIDIHQDDTTGRIEYIDFTYWIPDFEGSGYIEIPASMAEAYSVAPLDFVVWWWDGEGTDHELNYGRYYEDPGIDRYTPTKNIYLSEEDLTNAGGNGVICTNIEATYKIWGTGTSANFSLDPRP